MPQSRSEVNITAKMRDQIADRVVFHSDNLFDDPQKEVRLDDVDINHSNMLMVMNRCSRWCYKIHWKVFWVRRSSKISQVMITAIFLWLGVNYVHIAISEKLRQTEDAMRQEAREMKELKRKYMESQSRWRDMNVQRQVYLDLIRDLNVEAEGVKYILSVTVLEGDSICPRQGMPS